MPFPPQVVEDLLVRSARCCCLCRQYKGTKIEIHHIIPEAEGGTNDPDNGIPLCFDCHAEVNAYNDKHPRGRKYQPSELKRLRNQWFQLVASGKAPIPTYNPSEATQDTKQHRIINNFLSELKDNIKLAIARDPVGNILSVNAWQNHRGEIDFLQDFLQGLDEDMRDLYVLIMQTNNIISRLQGAYGWTVEQHKHAEWHISNLQTERDRNYEKIKEKAARIIAQLEFIKNQLEKS